MTTDINNYKDNDDLGLYLTIIESATVTCSPTRVVEFKIIRPLDLSKDVSHYTSGRLIFKGVYHCNFELMNEFYEYPEFYRSAVLEDSKLLRDTIAKLGRLKKVIKSKLRHYYLYIDQGNKGTGIHIICEKHELTLKNEPKLLTEFKGLDE